MNPHSHSFMPAVQGLRAVAVLAVLVFHAWPSVLPGGFVGVDIFFVISGFLISRGLLREIESYGTVDLAGFYVRRLRRLLPAALTVVLSTLLYTILFYSPVEIKRLTSTVIASILYTSNLWFSQQALDYFAADNSADPLLHTWSLAVEEQFYLVWPVFLFLAFRFRRSAPFVLHMSIAIAAASLLSYLLCHVVTSNEQSSAFFLTPFRVWEFGAGGLIALFSIHRRKQDFRKPFGQWVGALLLIVAIGWYSSRISFPAPAALLPVAGAALIISDVVREAFGVVLRGLASRPMVFIGDRSYSLYLWHWPVLIFFRESTEWASWVSSVVGVILSFALAEITFRWVENRFRVKVGATTKYKRSLLAISAVTCAGLGVGFAVRVLAIAGSVETNQLRFENARSDQPTIYRLRCHASFDVTEAQECVFGPDRSSQTVVLFGDSHAAQWFPALERIALEEGWRLFSFTKSSCPAAIYEPFEANRGRQYVECTAWRTNVLARIAEIEPDLVIISSSSRYMIGHSARPANYALWEDATRELLEKLKSHKVALIRDTPWPGFNVPGRLARSYWRHGGASELVEFEGSEPDAAAVFESESRVAAFFGAKTIDMNSEICRSGSCWLERDGIVVYSDTNHLTATFARSLAPVLRDRLRFADTESRQNHDGGTYEAVLQ